jgi:WD40 repeat protein
VNTFEITLQRKLGDGWPVVVEHTVEGDLFPRRAEGTFALDLATLGPLEEKPREYGMALGVALFRDGIRDAFMRARGGNQTELRVLLNVEASDLKTLRWERLCALLDGEWRFLALDQAVPFSQYLPSVTDQRFPPIGRDDLRALVLVASPQPGNTIGLAPFDAPGTIGSVCKALGEIPADVLTLGGVPAGILSRGDHVIGTPTLDELAKAITATHYTLLHVVCHGQYLKAGDGPADTVLYLAAADGSVDVVTATRLIERLRNLGGARGLPHLAFLSTCESASAEAEGALGGLAQRLVRDLGMPAVVAMTQKVTIKTAGELSSRFYELLRQHGEVDRALVEAGAGLAERRDIIVPVLYSRLGGRPLFSISADRPLDAKGIETGLKRFATAIPKRAPILATRLKELSATLRATLGTDLAALSPETRAQRDAALQDVRQLCIDVTDLTFDALAKGQKLPPYDSRLPFRGLSAFRPEDSEFFFGRDPLIEQLVARLAEYPFLAVLGPSGSGKSSVVLGGLLPKLGDPYVTFTPTADPLAQLDKMLAGAVPSAIVVVDQFEELFTLAPEEEAPKAKFEAARQGFIAKLLALVPGHRVILTMRADFWGECAPYPALKETMQAHQELIAPMDATELRRAMELQAGKVGLRFEADLSNTLLDDVKDEPGAMPLLQQALLELWKRRHGRWLRSDEYRAIGGVREAIGHTAEDLYTSLDPADQERVQDIFTVRLTRLDENVDPGQTPRDTRRRVAVSELVPAGASAAKTKALVAKLADARLVVTSVNAVTGQEEVEVVHEALIRYWPRLRKWLDDDRTNLRLFNAIREAAKEWDEGKRVETLLVHRGGRLEDAVRLSKQPRFGPNKVEQDYLDAAVALQQQEQQHELEQAKALADEQRQRAEAEQEARQIAERSAKRQRYLSVGLAVLVVLALFAAGAAFVLQQNAQREARVSLSQRIAAQSTVVSADRPDLALLLAVQAYRIDPNPGTESSLLAANQCCSDALLGFLGGHMDRLWDVAFSRDSKTLASAGNDGEVRIWDVASRKQIASIKNPDSKAVIYAVEFSPTDDILAVGDAVPQIVLYDTRTWKPIEVLPAIHTRSVFSLKFSKDGHKLVSGGVDGRVIVWDVTDPSHATGQVLNPVPATEFWVYDVAISPDGLTVAAVSKDGKTGTLRLWDLSVPDSEAIATPTSTLTLAIAFSNAPQPPMLVTGDLARNVIVWDLRPWQGGSRAAPPMVTAKNPISPSGGLMWGLAFVPNAGLSVVTGTDLGVIRRDRIVVDLDAKSLTFAPESLSLAGNAIGVFRIAISPDGSTMAGAGRDGLVSLWQASEAPQIIRHPASVNSERVMADGGSLMSVDGAGNLLRSSYVDRKVLSQVPLDRLPDIKPVGFRSAISGDGSMAAIADRTGRVMLFDAAGKRLALALAPRTRKPQESDPFPGIVFSPDGHRLAVGDPDGKLRIWTVGASTLDGPSLTADAPSTEAISALTYSTDGRTLVGGGCAIRSLVGCEQGEIFVWDADTLALRKDIQGKSGMVTSLAWDPDPRIQAQFAIASIDGTVTLWDIQSGQVGLVRRSSARINAVAYSPDGRLLAVGADADVFVYSAATQLFYGQKLKDHDGNVTSLAFAPDGSVLMSGSADGTIILEDMRPAGWVERACRLANRNLTRDEWKLYVGDAAPYSATCPGYPVEP